MDPLKPDELSDRELDEMLRKWKSPEPPERLRGSIFPHSTLPWWNRWWHASIRVPLPAGVALLAALMLVVWLWPAAHPAQPRVIKVTERVEVPVVRERVVTKTVYRDRPASRPEAVRAAAPRVTDREALRPVAELQPIVIGRDNAQN